MTFKREYKYVNEESKFWDHSYRVTLQEFDNEGIIVNADNEQDALDYAVDYAEAQGWFGLFDDDDDYYDDGECLFAGNHGHRIASSHVWIEHLD
jgi:hypothetical protein